jgi:hypothetical protein
MGRDTAESGTTAQAPPQKPRQRKARGELIHEAMAAIQADVSAIPKAERNKQQGYSFRSIKQVVEMLHPLLAEHGVLMLPTVEDQTRTEFTTKHDNVMNCCILTVRFDFVARDGSRVTVTTVGEGADTMDKATNKAMTAAQKYAMTLAFSIPFGDQEDADADSPGERATRSRPSDSHGGDYTVTEAQLGRLWAKSKAAAERLEVPQAQIGNWLRVRQTDLGLDSLKQLTKVPYDNLCDRLDALTLTQLSQETPPSGGGEAF